MSNSLVPVMKLGVSIVNTGINLARLLKSMHFTKKRVEAQVVEPEIEGELASGLANLGLTKTEAKKHAKILVAENPGASLEELIRKSFERGKSVAVTTTKPKQRAGKSE